jgi:hypothetical protein
MVRGEFQLKPGTIFQKKWREIEGSFLLFFFAGTKLIWTHFSLCFMYNTRALANSSLKILSRGLHRLFLHSKGVIIFLLPTQFFGLVRGKNPFQVLPNV